ncbi:unnamed protein product [Penicillium palitans]
MTFLYIFLLSFLVPALATPVPLHHRSKEHSVSVELIHLAAEKAPVIALGVGGAVLLALLLGEAISFFFWWARLKIQRNNRADCRFCGIVSLILGRMLVETLAEIEQGVLSRVVWEEKGAEPPV